MLESDQSSAARKSESTRVHAAYARYARSARRRRAWAADNPGNVAIREELLAAVIAIAGHDFPSASGAMLDIGCGSGAWLRALTGAGVPANRLTGIDIQPARVEASRRRVPDAQIVEGDARELPFEDDTFEVVFLLLVLSSLRDLASVGRVLDEARRVASMSALLFVYEPRFPNPFNRRTLRLARRDLDRFRLSPRSEQPLTVLPPLARRLGAGTRLAYPLLARVPPLLSHRLVSYRTGVGGIEERDRMREATRDRQ